MTEINPNELFARTRAYLSRHSLHDHPAIGVKAFQNAQDTDQLVTACGYLAGYDQRQQEDSGPTLDRDAALLAFKDGLNWHTMSGDLRLEYRAHATAARIMVGGTYAG